MEIKAFLRNSILTCNFQKQYAFLLFLILVPTGYIVFTMTSFATNGKKLYPPYKVSPYRINNWKADKFKNYFTYDGIWLVPQNQCSCPVEKGESIHDLKNYYNPQDMPSTEDRRRAAFIQHSKRLDSTSQILLIAEPNSPLSYPVQGVEVMPLHTILIPGLDIQGIQRSHYRVKLSVNLGVLNILSEVPQDVVYGQGEKQMTISTSTLKMLNFILRTVTYTSKVYTINSVDLVKFQFELHTAIFPIKIQQPEMLKLFDHGKEYSINSLVTITTKTFLRYHKLKTLIRSIRKFYPNMTIIVADDNDNPEKIEDPHLEQYFMPFAKGWFAGRNLAVSQVTTKYFLWVDDDFLFTEKTKIEKLVKVLEETPLDLVGGAVGDNSFKFKLLFEKGNEEEGDCLHWRSGSFHTLEGFPNCVIASGVVNFFLARTEQVRRVGFDPKLSRVAHTEFFVDGIGVLNVGSCTDVSVDHQPRDKPSDNILAAMENKYAGFRRNTNEQQKFKLREHFFKNRLKCFSRK